MSFTRRQQEILQTAVEIIAHRGIQELTIKNLSVRIGISEPAVYRHFESKHAILVSLIEYFSEWSRTALSEIQSMECTPAEKIRELFLRHTERFTASPEITGVIFAEEIFKNDAALSAATVRIMGGAERYVRSIFEEGVASGHFRSDLPVEHLGMVTLGSLRLLVTRWRLQGYGFDLPEEGRRLADSIIELTRV
jgi:TetR/AcrR family transcriptional regulator, fatty acid metabolism regulator protein